MDDLERLARAGQERLGTRLRERLAALPADLAGDPAALAQEVVRFVARSDVDEEIVRMRGHIEHWHGARGGREPCGRKLDFLLQEMNREINTIGSKAEGPRGDRNRDRRQGRARAAAGAGAECRVTPAQRGLLIVISAPSGTGKTTVVERLVEVCPGLVRSRSYTSRAAAVGRAGRSRL